MMNGEIAKLMMTIIGKVDKMLLLYIYLLNLRMRFNAYKCSSNVVAHGPRTKVGNGELFLRRIVICSAADKKHPWKIFV